MTEPVFHPLSERDLPKLIALMQEFYADQHMTFDEAVATAAVQAALRNGSLGRIFLIFTGDDVAGYFVLTFCFSLEFHGRFGMVDELYVREKYQGRGIGTQAEALAATICKNEGLRALRLEVGKENPAAESLYARLGFNVEPRKIMTKWL